MKATAATLRAAFAEATANRASMWTQIAAMAINDLAWITFWLLFFDQVGALRGWDRDSVLVLLAVLTTGGGLVLGLLSNTRRCGQIIHDGGLDAVLALPVRPLPVLLVRRVDPIAFGDVIFGLVLFAAIGPHSPADIARFLAVTLLGAAVFGSFLVIAGCSAFWLKGNDAGDFGFNAMLMLAAYPIDIFAGVPKLLVYTVVPAAFVAAVPARVVADADASDVLLLAVAAGGFVVTAWAVFTAGLRRYTGTSGWTRA